MTTKADLLQEIEELKRIIKDSKSVPQSISISNCNFDLKQDKKAEAIAAAVKEGMLALQALADQHTYGLYFNNGDD